MHVNAFSNMWMGSNTYRLLEALPHDMMHAFLHGVLMYVIEVIMSPLNPTEKFKLDGIVDNIIVPIRSSSRAQFPRCSFTRGITNFTLLTADERAGVHVRNAGTLIGFSCMVQKRTSFSEKTDMLKAIWIMMEQIKKYALRKDKNGWCLQTFHDLLHIVRDIENFGSPTSECAIM